MKQLLRCLLFILFAVTLLSVNVYSQTATVTSDKPDYAPLSNAVFTGSGFAPNEDVVLKVKNMTQPCNTTFGDSSYMPWTVKADALGNFVSNWTVCNCPGDSLKLRATGQTSGLIAIVLFSDAGQFSYQTSSGKSDNLSTISGTTDNSTLSVDVTAPKNNDTFTASLDFTTGSGTSIGIGSGSSQIGLTSISNSFSTGNSQGSNVTKTFPVTVSVGSSVPDGTYNFIATAISSTGKPNNNGNWPFTITVGSTSGSIGSVSIGTQSASVVYGTASSTTFDVNSLRGSNGSVNGTYSVSGLPLGVNYTFSVSTFTATGSNAFPPTTLTLNVPANLNAGSYNFTVILSNGSSQATATGTLQVDKAGTTTAVTVSGATYDGSAHGASSIVTGAGGLSQPVTVYYTGVSPTVYASSTTAPINAGTYSASATYAESANYFGSTDSKNFTILKANATVTVNGYTGTYDAASHGATGTATGVGGVDLSSGLNLGASFTDVPGGTANWTFSGGTNYNDQSGTAAIVITKADATVTVNGYTGTYDAAPHGATGTATGVDGVDLSSGLNLGTSFTDVPGGTVSWTFSGGINYNDQSGTAAIVINKADATVTMNGYTGIYDAAAHGATGTATGVGGVDLSSGLNLGASFTDVPGGTANWTFSGGTNYNDQSGTAAIVINKANATVTVTGYTGTYDAAAHGATGTATGVGGVDLSSGLNLGASFTDVPGGTANWTFSGGINYNDQSGTAAVVINKADATVTVNGYTGIYDAAAHGATGTATGVGGVDLSSGLDLGASFTDVPGGTANWTFTGGTNYNDQSGIAAIVINKANATVTVNGYTGVYDAAAHGATGSVAGVAGDPTAIGSSLNLGASFTDVPGGTANWTFSGGTNYNDQSGTAAIVINKANATVTVNGYTGVYDAASHGATGTATGVGGVDLSSGLDLGASFTDVPGGTASWTFSGGTNYNDQSGTAAIVINKANAIVTVNGYTGIYDAAAHGATGSVAGVAGDPTATGSSLDLGASFTDVPGGTANWTFTGGTNYNDQSGTAAIVINKANATVTVNGYTGTYDAAPHGATGSVAGVAGDPTAIGSSLDLGASFTDVPGGTASWTFSGGINYNDQSGTAAIVINKADATVTVNGYTGIYDAAPHGATGTATGVGGVDLSSGLDLGVSFTDVPGGTASWTFTGGTNYNDQSGTAAIVINKANATVTVNGYTGTYDAAPHGATGTATGVGGVDLSSGLDLGASFTDVPGGTASWTFSGGTNYNDQSGTAAIVISKANATVTVNGYTGTYDAAPHGATGSVAGVAGDPTATGSSLNLGASFTDVPGGTASWTFTGGTNYNDQSGTAAIVINKANATVTVNGYTGIYDAAPHGATGTATGVSGVDLSSGLNLGASFTDVPGGTANWTFSGGTNYNDQSGTAAIVINKANATVTVNGYTGIYDAAPHGATGTATGVGGVDLSSGLNLGASFTDVPGGTANWTFSGGTNYNDQSGIAAIVINKANATVTVNGYTGIYDAAAHGATGSVAGVAGDPTAAGSSLDLGATFTDVPGGTANWTFTGGTNYNDQSGIAAIVINKANATVTVNGYTGIYDAAAHGATGSVAGVAGDPTATGSSLNLGTTFTDVPGGTASWTFTGGTNYNDQSGTAAIVINKANAIVTVNGYTGIYDAAPHGATGNATGVGGVDLSSGLNLGASFTNVPGGTANWTFSGGINYNDQSGTAAIVINKANATVTVTGYTGIYDAVAHGATGSVAGVAGDPTATGSSLDLGASFTDVPGGTANWTFSGGTNYNDQSGTAAIVINKADASVTPDAAGKYCGQSDPSFTGTLSGFLPSDNVTASYSRTPSNESVGASYTINATLSPIGVLNNYNIAYNTANFTINSVSIDASATSTAIQLGTATKTLTATVTSGIIPVNAASVTFTVTNNVNGNVNTIATVGATTGSNGVATYNLNSGSLPVGLYAVTAVAGSGCAQSVAYFSVYDPNAGFVTGGGWINSPIGAYSADPTLTGKANFGFNAQYKKGNNTPDGNTEFQFQAGNLNFKSSNYATGSLVIAGAKAIFQGTGTINGTGNYNFMISAIDGSISGGGGVDKFRIKIWTSGGGVVYDNNMGTLDNGDPTTVLGGGSIVIHIAKNSSNRITNTSIITADTIAIANTPISIDQGLTVNKLTIKVMPNPAPLFFTLDIQSPDNGKIKITVVDIAGRVIEQRTDVPANSTVQIGSSYHPGVYFAEVMQGKVKIVLRLIKGRD